MKKSLRIISVLCAIAGAQSLSPARAQVEDVPPCHDLPVSQGVLDSGLEYIRQNPGYVPAPRRGPGHGFADIRTIQAEENIPQFEEPAKETKASIQAMKLGSDAQFWSALLRAENLEKYKQPDLALLLYERLDELIGKCKAPVMSAHFRVCEGLTRTTLGLQYTAFPARELYFPDWEFRKAYDKQRNLANASRFSVVDAVKKISSTETLRRAEKLSKTAFSLRNNSYGYTDAAADDLMILGALAENNNHKDKAFSYYLSAMQLRLGLDRLPIDPEVPYRNIEDHIDTILGTIEKSNETPETKELLLSETLELLSRSSVEKDGVERLTKKANTLITYERRMIAVRPCLNMAADLNDTAANLESREHYDMANKLYSQAVKIKEENFGPESPELAQQLLDLARVEAEQNHIADSAKHYEEAIMILKKEPGNLYDLRGALEQYAQMLAGAKQNQKADLVYNEARDLALHGEVTSSKWTNIPVPASVERSRSKLPSSEESLPPPRPRYEWEK